MEPEQRGLGDHCAANWGWNAGGGWGSLVEELPDVLTQELSSPQC